MATTSVINSKIKRGSTTYTKIQVGSNIVYRVVAGGNLSYDRKDYEFSASGSISIPVGGTNNVASLVSSKVTSKYTGYTNNNTKVVGAAASYACSPASIASNAHNTSSKSGTISVQQENSNLTGSVSWSQPADSYEVITAVTSITLTLGTPSVIPASGGSVNSCSYTVVANGYTEKSWASGGATDRTTGSWTVTNSATVN